MKIPSTSIPRLSLYYRAILSVRNSSVISSQELAEKTSTSACQVRKDLAYFGQFGTPGQGYDIELLEKTIRKILGIDRLWDVALVGAGNLGSALLAYKGFKDQGFNINHAFDNDINKINKIKQGIRIKDIRDIQKEIKHNKIKIAILAVPKVVAQDIIDKLIAGGVKAILNFTPIRPKEVEGVKVLNIDLSVELEKLTYFLQKEQR